MAVQKVQSQSLDRVPSLFASYVQIAKSLLRSIDGVCLLGPSLESLGATCGIREKELARWFTSAKEKQGDDAAFCALVKDQKWVTAMTLERSDGRMLGVLCVTGQLHETSVQPARHARLVQTALQPLLACIYRDLLSSCPEQAQLRTMTERSSQLEWLFELTNSLRESTDDARLVEKLLEAAIGQLQAGFATFFIPGKRLSIERCADADSLPTFKAAWSLAKQSVLAWAQRQHRPLVVNHSHDAEAGQPNCKLLAVPVVRKNGFVIGVLAFLKSPKAPNFSETNLFLARHLGRQAGQLVDRQFDLMSGLYTRGGLEELALPIARRSVDEHSIVYLDIDHMHVINELHGFEMGNELIVRVAELLTAPLLPESALAARVDSDRFAVVLPSCTLQEAAKYAQDVIVAAGRLAIGPIDGAIHISISGGIAPLLDVDPPFQRALSSAELACKTAKSHGRGRVEIYALDDASILRRHSDIVAVGRIREALKVERFLLYAQPVVSLSESDCFSGYEILLRIREEDGTVVSAGDLMHAASRYELLPSIDRWVTKRALEMLAPYRSMLNIRGISMSLNVTGQSISDESFVTQFSRQLREARLPANCIAIEITEQAAVTNLARARTLIDSLKTLGCQFALNGFGTGAKSLTTLQVTKLKIDGSFVRNVMTDRNSHSTVRAIVELARGLAIDTVAEYVETPEIATELRRLGVDYAQGNAFGKPEALSDILRSLNEGESRCLHRLHIEA